MKIVINNCFGVFSLSEEAYEELGLKWDGAGYEFSEDRTNEKLIKCIEKIGAEKASGQLAKLKIIEIPNGIDYEIGSYDGLESVYEKSRRWD
jgi:hypothetical protein